MEAIAASWPSPERLSGPEQVNEDAFVVGDGFAVVLDGATAEPGDPGCRHGVAWYVGELASCLGAQLIAAATGKLPLPCLVHDAIATVRDRHGPGCDLANPRSPSATVAILRERGGAVEHFVLGDSAVVLDAEDALTVVVDDRITQFDHVPWEHLHRHRNVHGGFWVAAADPRAAWHARTGTVPVTRLSRAVLLTDGGTRLAERYGWKWTELLDLLDRSGPVALLAATRHAEDATAPSQYEGKRHDDLTAVLCRFSRSPGLDPPALT
jgi:hypothetical protein